MSEVGLYQLSSVGLRSTLHVVRYRINLVKLNLKQVCTLSSYLPFIMSSNDVNFYELKKRIVLFFGTF